MTRSIVAALSLCWLAACNGKKPLFEKLSASRTGIVFNNQITENDSINPMDVVNIYNGGGVGIGDFNNDGLADIFLTGNRVPSRLYLNKGGFRFEDITTAAGVEGLGRWARGVSIVDINNDGLPDIYICNTIYKDSLRRRNILYVNQGTDKEGIPYFKDLAAEYGLDIHVQSTMASFFDYDNDGDLDMYLAVNEASNGYNSSVFVQRHNAGVSAPNRGRLYRNEMDPVLKHPVFHDVSDSAGITLDGYGHAATICDLNGDGWKDIYVSNDFLSSNLLYINNHDGTFTNRAKEYFKHTSFNSMGQDVVDINNDGLPDVVELDMNPEDNYRKKMMSAANNTNTYQNFDQYGYQYQYVRNTLQLNQGPALKQNDSTGIPVFSEIGFQSGISQTDWSWTPLITDFDNDGYRDLVITNGFPRDVSDHDFMAYRQQSTGTVSKTEMIRQIPQIKLHNYAFRNTGDCRFADRSLDWGLETPTFSSGAAYADLDNDGAMDMVVNNINDPAFIYRNTTRDKDTASTHFLHIIFAGDAQNRNGLGATAAIYYDHGKQQVFENNPYRGYLSTMQLGAHFGLGKTNWLDSVVIKWPNLRKQTLTNVRTGQLLTVKQSDANETYTNAQPVLASGALFREITDSAGMKYTHKDVEFIDFNIQNLLPHKLSEYCPALAAGDIDGNGLDDLVIGGNAYTHAHLFLQQPNGRFIQKDLLPNAPMATAYTKDEGILLFDANGDGKPDLYIAAGGYKSGGEDYHDRLYINDGKGNFNLDSTALPLNNTPKLCVRAMDIDNDGKLDLFVSGRVDPGHYPTPVSSFILHNDGANGHAKFTDVTAEVAPDLQKIGMVCDALFTDFDGDGQTDLIVVGEWMAPTFLKNINGKFSNVTATSGVGDKAGWWNSIVGGDFRHLGRMDYILGNQGQNTLYQASDSFPVYMTAKDFDISNNFIAIPSLFLKDIHGEKKEFPAPVRDDIAKHWSSIKKRYPNFKPFALATMDELLTPEQRNGALRLKATMLQSCYCRNDGGGKFTLIPLPAAAQVSVLNGMLVDDFDGDGNLDVLINGNDYGTQVDIGRYDALNGLLLKGDGAGGFTPLTILQSGIYIPGDGKALVKLKGAGDRYLVAASQYKDELKLFESKKSASSIPIGPDDRSATIHFRNGKIQKQEFYYGSSFLSQSARFLPIDSTMTEITITDRKGRTRKIR